MAFSAAASLLLGLLCLTGWSCNLVAAQAPKAWECGEQRDYFAKVTTVCADATCNARQRNIGGELLVLDTKSYGAKGCQGCNLDVPATCCEACRDTDGCNAWVVCTKKGGCGAGCQAYRAKFKAPIWHTERLPHTFWGNWGSCEGDAWPPGMCSLKVVADAANPPVTSSNPADGWVSGVVPKSAADPRCPPTMSAKSCKACLSSKAPAKCIACIAATKTLAARDECTTCASLPSSSSQDRCIACLSGPNASKCSACLDADCSSTDCMNAQRADRSRAPNLAAADACFACQAAALGSSSSGGDGGSKVELCAKCFEASSVPPASRASCIAAITSPGTSPAVSAGRTACYDATVSDRSKCMACAAKGKTQADGRGCGACSAANNVPASFTDACYVCVLNSPDEGAKSYCSNLDRDTSAAAVAAFYKCLATAKGPDAPATCWQCYRTGDAASAAACYACMAKVSGPTGIHCSHCFVPSRIKSGAAVTCEACIRTKDNGRGEPGDCWR